jgi:hypothetical protein
MHTIAGLGGHVLDHLDHLDHGVIQGLQSDPGSRSLYISS